MALPAMSAEYTSPEVPATRGLHTWSSWGILGNQECRHRSDDQPHTQRLRSSRVRRFLGSRRSGHHRSCHVRLAAGSARCGSAAFHVAPSTVFPDSGLKNSVQPSRHRPDFGHRAGELFKQFRERSSFEARIRRITASEYS